jgi:Tfp pilus assembly protein PilE
MGQQQLLLVILVTIIVGIATVVAINTFGTSAEQANIDAVRNDIASVATSAQAWYIRPAILEGGGNSYTLVNFGKIPFAGTLSADSLTSTNANGSYVISGRAANTFIVTGTPTNSPNTRVTGTFTVADGLSIVTTEVN